VHVCGYTMRRQCDSGPDQQLCGATASLGGATSSEPAMSAGSGRLCRTRRSDEAYTGRAPAACAQQMYTAAAVCSSSADDEAAAPPAASRRRPACSESAYMMVPRLYTARWKDGSRRMASRNRPTAASSLAVFSSGIDSVATCCSARPQLLSAWVEGLALHPWLFAHIVQEYPYTHRQRGHLLQC